MKTYNLYISLSLKEKQILSEEAKDHGMKLTGYVKSLLPLNQELHKKCLIINDPKRYQQIKKRDKVVKVYFTENELYALRIMAKDETVSRYIARTVLEDRNAIHINVQDHDLDFVSGVIEPLYSSIYQHLYNIKLLSTVNQDTITNILAEIRETNSYLLQLCDYVKKNRRSIRDARLRDFRKCTKQYIDNFDFVEI